jgi:hypothetical protein
MNRISASMLMQAAVISLASAQGTNLPWGQPSDMVAWEVFVQITAPAGNPQTTNVEFETWASDEDIYRTNPPKWPNVGTTKQLQLSALGTALHGIRPSVVAPGDCNAPSNANEAKAAGMPDGVCLGEEVRRNWASFQYIVSNNLYSTSGFADAYKKGFKVDLPSDAIEFKGDWMRVGDVMKWHNLTEAQVSQFFYVNTASKAGSLPEKYALVAFHFSSKQIKDWVWADFEHQMTPGRCDTSGCHDSFGATVAEVPPKTPLNQRYGECQKSPAVQGMFTNAGISAVWQNYCLKGSQITFVDANGQPTTLGNSVIERINADVAIINSSCITCHGYASFDKNGSPNSPFAEKGKLDTNKLKGYATNDFIWGLLLAK